MDTYPLAKAVLFNLAPETAHHVTLKALQWGITPRYKIPASPILKQNIFGACFDTPVGLAAGFDKNAVAVKGILNLGFGFVEMGTVTPLPQNGNPKPRIFRDIPNEAVINRMGFPNGGAQTFLSNIKAFRKKYKGSAPIGLNIGMNKTSLERGGDLADDYCALVKELAPYADYLTVNISSPNTPGLRDLQSPEVFLELMGKILEARTQVCTDRVPPLFVKLAPDLNSQQRQNLAHAILKSGIDGVILTNTTLSRPNTLDPSFAAEKGGLSGKPLCDLSTAVIGDFYRILQGRVPIIGAGGIASAEDAYKKIRAGACLVQLYSGLIYKGPRLPTDISEGLIALLKRDNFDHISQAIGADIITDKQEAAHGL
jgi:dihydroorotate dehydrogenase